MTDQPDTPTPNVVKASAKDAGCWIDGRQGQYATPTLVQIAQAHGWGQEVGEGTDYDLSNQWIRGKELTNTEVEKVISMADEAEVWLNENVAPEGFQFGWYEGEFFLWSDEQWEDEGD